MTHFADVCTFERQGTTALLPKESRQSERAVDTCFARVESMCSEHGCAVAEKHSNGSESSVLVAHRKKGAHCTAQHSYALVFMADTAAPVLRPHFALSCGAKVGVQ